MIDPILYTYEASLIRVVDADTIILDLDRGFKDHSIKTIRLSRVDAPEIRGEEKEQGKVAKQWVEETLSKSDRLTIQSQKLDAFGRSIAELWYWEGDRWINLSDELLEKGLARKYQKHGQG